MNVFITGGLGFIGRNISDLLLKNGHKIVVTGTKPFQDRIDHENFSYIFADTRQKGRWQEALGEMDAVINLAGRTIFKRWSKGYKAQIHESRVLTTRHLVEALPEHRDIVLLSVSGVGYYGNRADDRLTEEQPPSDDFLARLCQDWEKEAFKAEEKGVRVVVARLGVVVGKAGGAMAKMIPAFRFFLGGPLGNGNQWFSWIHLDDLASAILFVVNGDAKGAFNFCSPHPVRNRELAKTLGRALKRPAIMPAPAFMIRLIMGEMGSLLLFSQQAVPAKLLECGFRFQYPDIKDAIASIV